MFEDNINIIVGIGAGVVGLIALGILWIVVRRLVQYMFVCVLKLVNSVVF